MSIRSGWIAILAIVGILLSGCKKNEEVGDNNGNVSVMSVSLDKTILVVEVNGTSPLAAAVAPEGAVNQQVTWYSDKETVATVSDAGVVTGKATGTATVTVTTLEGGYTASCTVTVVNDMEDYFKTLLLNAFGEMGVDDATFSSWKWEMETPLNNWSGIDYEETVSGPQLEIERYSYGLNTFSPVLCQIPGLIRLALTGNNFSCPIPDEIGNLTQLKELDFYNCSFTGKLPETLGNLKNLEYLDLEGGYTLDPQPFPTWLCGLTNLENLYLARCNLTGSIPPMIENLTRLRELDLTDNRLIGIVPEGLKKNPNYTDFELNPQQENYGLTDAAPGEADKAALLAIKEAWGTNAPMSVQYTWREESLITSFAGVVTVNGFGQVTALNFYGSQISSLPDMSALTQLTNLDLSVNNLTEFPVWICSLSQFESLYIERNQISSPIPDEIGNLTQLKELVLYDNFFTGKLPETLGNLKNLEYLDLDGLNTLDPQPFPMWLCGLTNLEMVYLNDCNLTGSIPAELGNLTKLKSLYLYNNNLTGVIPDEVLNHPYFDAWYITPQNPGYGFDSSSASSNVSKAIDKNRLRIEKEARISARKAELRNRLSNSN